jgi:bifunctional DNA-binding transcriptional regulator/antitoxin component of YhaV-PrlF toxin-antitoxin module
MSESAMTEYTLRVAGKRQVTLPEEIVTALNLEKGDEFRIVVRTPTDIRLVPYTRVRSDLITPEIEKILAQRRKEIEDGEEMFSLEEVLKRAAVKNRAAARKRAAAAAASSVPASKAGLRARERMAEAR